MTCAFSNKVCLTSAQCGNSRAEVVCFRIGACLSTYLLNLAWLLQSRGLPVCLSIEPCLSACELKIVSLRRYWDLPVCFFFGKCWYAYILGLTTRVADVHIDTSSNPGLVLLPHVVAIYALYELVSFFLIEEMYVGL